MAEFGEARRAEGRESEHSSPQKKNLRRVTISEVAAFQCEDGDRGCTGVRVHESECACLWGFGGDSQSEHDEQHPPKQAVGGGV